MNLKTRTEGQGRMIPVTDKAMVAAAMKLREAGEVGKGKRVTFNDPTVPGLRLVVGSQSATWTLSYRLRGSTVDGQRHPQRTATIGEFAVGNVLPANYLTIASARAAALKLKEEIKDGFDPLAAKTAAALAAAELRAESRSAATAKRSHIDLLLSGKPVPAPHYEYLADATMAECCEIYRKRAPRKATIRQRSKDDAHRFAVRALETMEATQLKPQEITKAMLDTIANTVSPAQALHMIGEVMRILKWLHEHDALDRLPKVKTPKPPPSRKRFYSGEEIQKIWAAAGETGDDARADYLRAVILLPLRRMELANVTASAVQVRDGLKVLVLEITKNDEPFLVPLRGEALKIIERRCKNLKPSDLIFPVRNSWSDWYEQLRELSGVADFRVHDLRRTFSSQASKNGVADVALVDKCLNHKASNTHSGVLGVYQQSDLLEKRASIFEAWGAMVERAVATGSFKASNVIELRAAQ